MVNRDEIVECPQYEIPDEPCTCVGIEVFPDTEYMLVVTTHNDNGISVDAFIVNTNLIGIHIV